jgi:16S rRNA (cytidine1402-2'-O)-methyltransferase
LAAEKITMEQFGTLYIVATPIGNLEDISSRAVNVLASVDIIAAEDTRHSKKLLQSIQVQTQLVSYHDFSSPDATAKIVSKLEKGDSIALISDAGTPLISDPGYKLVKSAREKNISVVPIPGASAVTAALSVAGIPTDRFIFEGFLPSKTVARTKYLQELVLETRTLVFYESPHRIVECLADIAKAFGTEREIFVAREISKKFESHFLGSLAQVLEWIEADPVQQKGEFVLVLAGCGADELRNKIERQALDIVELLRGKIPMKQAVTVACEITGARKNTIYGLTLKPTAQED